MIKQRWLFSRFLFPLSFLMTSCVGPDYERPDIPLPKKWANGSSDSKESQQSRDESWWHHFKDPDLEALIWEASKSNLDYLSALARIREARANYGEVESNLFPTINAEGSAGRSFTGPNVPRRVTSASPSSTSSSTQQVTNQTVYKAGFDATWELDLFGAILRGEESAVAILQSTEENARVTFLSLIAEVAQNYIVLRQSQQELEITQQIARLWQKSYELQMSLENAGLISQLLSSATKSSRDQAMAALAPVRAKIETTLHRLSVLLGKDPSALSEQLSKRSEGRGIPYTNESVIAGLPSELILRRPDIRASERLLASATAQIGVSIAGLFPHFQLTGSYDFERNQPRNLITPSTQLWQYALNFSVPIFDFWKIRSQIEAKYAQKDQAFFSYKKSILTALEEVENGLVTYAQDQSRYRHLQEQVAAIERIHDLTAKRHKAGLVNYLDVIQAKINFLNNQIIANNSKATASQNLVSLYKALGGGWEITAGQQSEISQNFNVNYND